MTLPADYPERVYAGVLGKIIGVYSGKPFEQWPHEKIMAELGEVHYYVHEKMKAPLVATDDDISGTFTFIRALEDHDYPAEITAEQIGRTWMNYIIENKSILWWGGMGTSTEHTAFLRLKHGIAAPRSGSSELNTKTVAEQIGAQIFIDGWGMVCPGDPERAARMAKSAGSVSHDGEAVYAGQVVAAMEALAFVERDLGKLLDAAVGLIPKSSTIYKLIAELRECRAKHEDWQVGRRLIAAKYDYDKFGGGCHVVPNHAIIMLGLLWANDDFQRSLMITNTAGRDTDCNAGNVGCIMAIKNGLAGIDAGPDWRGPVADRLLLPTADGGRCITDAAREAISIANAGRALQGLKGLSPKKGARFHFVFPGSVQGFVVDEIADGSGTLAVRQVTHGGVGALELGYAHLAAGGLVRAGTPTFISLDTLKMQGYGIHACPTLYSGQTVQALLMADKANHGAVKVRLYVKHYNKADQLSLLHGPEQTISAGKALQLEWKMPDTDRQPIAEVGIELSGVAGAHGSVYLESLTWAGAPTVDVMRPIEGGKTSLTGWVDGTQVKGAWDPNAWIQNEGRGVAIYGTREWTDYQVSAMFTPGLFKSCGLAARVQGLNRYYAFMLLPEGTVQLVKWLDEPTVLASKAHAIKLPGRFALAVEVVENAITCRLDGQVVFRVVDKQRPLTGGAMGIVIEEGKVDAHEVLVRPVAS